MAPAVALPGVLEDQPGYGRRPGVRRRELPASAPVLCSGERGAVGNHLPLVSGRCPHDMGGAFGPRTSPYSFRAWRAGMLARAWDTAW